MDENLYHQLQYDRIDQLETKRENFSNYVLTICSGIFILWGSNYEKINFILSIGVFVFGLFLNIIAILFIQNTRPFIKMHQKRAQKIRAKYDPFISEIHHSIPKPKVKIKRHTIYILLHLIIILFFALIPTYTFFAGKEVEKALSVKLVK